MTATHPTPCRIGIDGGSVVGPRTGIGYSTAQLLNAMSARWPDDFGPAHVWVNSPRHELPDDSWRRSEHFRVSHTRWPGRALMRSWQHLKWPKIERFVGPVDFVHAPSSYIPPVSSARRLLTVFDIYFKYAPHHTDAYGGKYFLKTFARGLARMDHIIAISEFTRSEMLRHYDLDPERITVIPLGVDTERFHTDGNRDEDVALIEKLGLRRPYLLCVATAEPRKNLVTLIEAYARFRQIMLAGSQQPPRLVIAGQPGWGIQALQERLAEASIVEYVDLPGYVPSEALPSLYRQATAFVFPSLYEGFGLPALEAMACGCPTLLAQAGSLPEVAGSAAMYFNPKASDHMARILARFIADPGLRGKMREKGYERIKQFTWDATARATLDVYRHLLDLPKKSSPIAS